MGKLLVWVLCCVSLIGNAQEDTIRVMHYNLLNYGNYTSYCTSLNNNIDNKDDYLKFNYKTGMKSLEEFNVLVSTSVAEEGLDIPKVHKNIEHISSNDFLTHSGPMHF